MVHGHESRWALTGVWVGCGCWLVVAWLCTCTPHAINEQSRACIENIGLGSYGNRTKYLYQLLNAFGKMYIMKHCNRPDIRDEHERSLYYEYHKDKEVDKGRGS